MTSPYFKNDDIHFVHKLQTPISRASSTLPNVQISDTCNIIDSDDLSYPQYVRSMKQQFCLQSYQAKTFGPLFAAPCRKQECCNLSRLFLRKKKFPERSEQSLTNAKMFAKMATLQTQVVALICYLAYTRLLENYSKRRVGTLISSNAQSRVAQCV